MAKNVKLTNIRPTASVKVSVTDSTWKRLTTIVVDGAETEKLATVADFVEVINSAAKMVADFAIVVTTATMKDGNKHTFISFQGSSDLTEVGGDTDLGAVMALVRSDAEKLSALVTAGVLAIG